VPIHVKLANEGQVTRYFQRIQTLILYINVVLAHEFVAAIELVVLFPVFAPRFLISERTCVFNRFDDANNLVGKGSVLIQLRIMVLNKIDLGMVFSLFL
jgi:hypothetical protein